MAQDNYDFDLLNSFLANKAPEAGNRSFYQLASAMPVSPALVRSASYRPELDGFRVVPVLLVVAQHWLHQPWVRPVTGSVGVTTFFVLSGYFMTNILRRAKASGSSWHSIVRPFYLRRAFRILPAYFILLAIAWILDLSYVRAAWSWFMLQGSNFVFFRHQSWGEGVGHLWSLALEEQFYLLWPAVILLTPTVWLQRLLVVLAITGPVWRWLLLHTTGTSFSLVLLPAHLDLFALGGWLGLALPSVTSELIWKQLAWVALAATTLLKFWGGSIEAVFLPSMLGILAVSILALLLQQRLGWGLLLLRHPVAVWLGKRSYGLYLYHLLMPVVLHRLLHHLSLRWFPDSYAAIMAWENSLPALLLMAAMVVILASWSWTFIELPFKRLARRFPYPQLPRPA